MSSSDQEAPKEKLAELRGRLDKIRALAQRVQLPAGASQAEGDLRSRLKRARLLDAKVSQRKAPGEEEEEETGSQLQQGKTDRDPTTETRCRG